MHCRALVLVCAWAVCTNSNFIMLWAHFTVTVSPSLVSNVSTSTQLDTAGHSTLDTHYSGQSEYSVFPLLPANCLPPANW